MRVMPWDEDRIWEEKLKSLLHDPLDKPLKIINHEQRAKDLRKALKLADESSRRSIQSLADVFASASDRNPVTHLFKAEWTSEPEFYHPVSGKGKSGDLLASQSRNLLSVDGECLGSTGTLPPDTPKDLIRKLARKCSEEKSGECVMTQRLINKLERLVKRFPQPGGRKKQFLYLWRTLDTQLMLDHLSEIVPFLPAETRIPDHTMMDHLVTAAALTPIIQEEDEAALVSVEIGGVGEFVSQSRKVRDIWASSYLVSLLTLLISRIVSEELGPDSLIFPDLRGNPLMDLYLLSQEILSWDEIQVLWPDPAVNGKSNFFKKLLVPSLPDHVLFFAPKSRGDKLMERIRGEVNKFFFKLGSSILKDGLGLSDLENSEDIEKIIKRQLSGLPYPLSLRMDYVVIKIPQFSWEDNEDLDSLLNYYRDILKEFVPPQLTSWESGDDTPNEVNLIDEFAKLMALFLDAIRAGLGSYDVVHTTFYPLAFLVLRSKMRHRKLTEEFEHPLEPGEEAGKKVSKRCMLCGSRNPLFTGEGSWLRRGWENLVKWMEDSNKRERWLFSEREPLCSLGMLKRLLLREGNLIKAWSIALGLDEERLRDLLNKGERVAGSLKEAVGRIPTIDDVAIVPFRRRLESALNSLDELKDHLITALVQVVGCRRKCRSEGRESPHLDGVLSELGGRFTRVADILLGESALLLKDVLDNRFKELGDIPGSLLFPSTWNNVKRELEECGCEFKLVEDLIDFLKERFGGKDPSNYVTMVKLDGDQVGRWISGIMFIEQEVSLIDRLYCLEENEGGGSITLRGNCSGYRSYSTKDLMKFLERSGHILRGIHRLVTPSLHRNMSSILRNLSLIYPELVSELGGVTLYSAGDEMLAIVPASRTLDLVESVISAYRSLSFALGGQEYMGMGPLTTMSGGAAISHRLVPMSHMLAAVEAEFRVAKDGSEDSPPGSKNRVSFTRMTRGGSSLRAVIDGDRLRNREASDLLNYLADLMDEGLLSRNFSKEFLEFTERFFSKAFKPGDVSSVEPLVRLVVRRNLHGSEEERENAERELVRRYLSLIPEDEEVPSWYLSSGITPEVEKVRMTLERSQMVHMHRLMEFLLREVLFDGNA